MYFEKKQLTQHIYDVIHVKLRPPVFLSLMVSADLVKTASDTLSSGSSFHKLEASGIRFALMDKSLPSGNGLSWEECQKPL